MLFNSTILPSTTGRSEHVSSFVFRSSPGGLKAEMPPYSSLRTRRHFFFSLLITAAVAWLGGCTSSPERLTSPTIIVDGDFNDWTTISDAGDLVAVSNGRHLWIRLRLDAEPVSLQNLDEPWTLEIDFDDERTDDLRIIFSPSRSGRGVGYQSIRNGNPIDGSPYDVGFLFAPTVSSADFEMKLDAPVGSAGTIRLRTGADATMQQARFTPQPPSVAARSPRSVPQSAPDVIRIVSWNVRYGRLLHEQERSARILTALQPDILLLQELEDGQSPRDVADFLNATLGRDPIPWNVTASPVGSGLRSMAASRGGVQLDDGNAVLRSGTTDRFLRAAIIGAPVPGQGMLLASSVHLKCCGAPGDESDMERIAEAMSLARTIEGIVNRHDQQDRALARATDRPLLRAGDRRIAGVIIGGDLNLVGSRVPLEVLASIRTDRGDLEAADLLHLDESSNATWSDASSSFTPGRLDYILYSTGSLDYDDGFVLDTRRMGVIDSTRTDLDKDDTMLSDHAPLVLDVRTGG